MALAPADFYAYSRATGIPVPEDPEERAAMAPEVAAFRRNQLKAPEGELVMAGLRGFGPYKNVNTAELEQRRQELSGEAPRQESNALQTLGLAALGLGAAAGTVLGARQLLRQAPAKKVSTGRGTVLTDLTPALETAKRYTAASTTPPPSKVAQPEAAVKPSTIDLSDVIPEPTIEELEEALTAPRQYVYRPKGGIQDVATEPSYADQLITDPNTGEIFRRGKSPESFAQTYVPLGGKRTSGSFLEFSKSASGETALQRLLNDPELKQLVAQQKRQEGAELGREAQRQMRIASAIESEADQYLAQLRQESLASQALGALESGEDQMTGRIMRGVQRNEDLDASQINELAVQTGNVNTAAALTPDGIPTDQTDLWGTATVPKPVSTKQNPTLLLPAAAVSPREKAQQFLQNRFNELGAIIPGPYRRERAMASDPAVAEAIELYASTGDPNVLSRFSSAPSSPLTVKPMVQMAINQEELPTKTFFKATGYPEYVGDLLQEDIELTNQISQLGLQQQNLIKEAKELGEQELMLRVAMDRDPPSGGTYTKMFAQVKNKQQNLPDPASLNVDLGDAISQREFVRNQMNSLQNLGSTYRLTNVQEGVRPYFEYDELGRIIPATLELRTARQSVDLGPKTKGGRFFAEYDPEGQTGSTKGIYGVEQTRKQSSASTRPTELTMSELVREGMEQASASPEGDVPIPPSVEQITERRPTAVAKRSIEASEIVRRAMIEGRDPQMILRQRGFRV